MVVGFSLRMYWRRLKITGKKKIPRGEQGILMASNHPNTFMDPIIITVLTKIQTSFLVRSDVFKPGLADKFLRSINMLPIYRQGDKVDNIRKKNDEIFEICYKRLHQKKAIIIFTEGSHSSVKKLRSIKKGVGRIAFGAEEAFDFKLNSCIQPVGVNYIHDVNRPGGDVLLKFGEPIQLRDYLEQYRKHPAKALLALISEVKKRQRELVIHISDKTYYHTIHRLLIICRESGMAHLNLSGKKRGLENEFKAQKRMIAAVEEWISKHPEEAVKLAADVAAFDEAMEKTGLRNNELNLKVPSVAVLGWRGLFLLLGLPVFLYGYLCNIVPFTVPEKIVKKFKDVHFHDAVRMSVATFLFPVWWAIVGIAGGLFIEPDVPITLLFVGSLIVSAYLAFWWKRSFRRWNSLRRLFNLSAKNDVAWVMMQALKSRITKTITEIL